MGGAQGGLARQGPRPTSTYTTLQLRLQIALVFDVVFLRFWLHLGSQDGLENRPKSLKNHLRNCTPTSKRLRSDFYRFFLRFSTPWGSKNLAKTFWCCSFLHFSQFPLELPSGIDFGPSRPPFWSGFGSLFLSFFASKTDQKIINFLHLFFYEFDSILDSKRLPYDGLILGKSPPREVQDRLEDVALIFCLSWLRFGTLLGRFWHHFGRFWYPFL